MHPMQKRLKVGLDAVPLRYPYSGVRAYVEALIDAYRNQDSGIALDLIPSPGELTPSNRLARLYWDSRGVAASARASGVDLLHMTRFAAPWRIDRPFVVTVHDLIPLQLPEYRASVAARIQVELASRSVRRATRIIVPSTYVAGAVADLFQFDPWRIDVIPMGVSLPSDPSEPPLFSGPYVVHTGGFDVRKNLPVLLSAFAQAARELGTDWRLILVGAPHSANPTVYPPILPVIDELELQNRVVLTGRVSEREKHMLYRHATLAVNPSLSEGFGLPILEAMAHGIPVIASNCTAHPEVAGDAALLVDPSVDALAGALIHLAGNAELRSRLSAKGLARAAEFPWSRTANATLETYRQALDR